MVKIGSVMDIKPDHTKVPAIIAARPGINREVLRSLLSLLPQIKITGTVDSGLLAINLICKNPPALLIIDSGLLKDEMAASLSRIKQEQPQIRCLVLADTTRQRETFLLLGADAVILRNEPTENLVEALDNIGLW